MLFPRSEQPGVLQGVLVNTSGGLVGGDRLNVGVSVAESGKALITTQAAEKVYRSLGAECGVSITLEAASDSWLEWMPQETILFEGARLRRKTVLIVSKKGRALAGEMLVFGRIARGESFTWGLLHDEWKVILGDRLVWADRSRAFPTVPNTTS